MVVQGLSQWINGPGHGKLIMKSDQEPAANELVRAKREERLNVTNDEARNVISMGGGEDERGSVDIVVELFSGRGINV